MFIAIVFRYLKLESIRRLILKSCYLEFLQELDRIKDI